ncbi:MAG: hypothetical protein Q4C96_09525 [Planctomycetia bacterium]|nr:hypothetical protein [Planctomycetia bacterium]
MNTIKLFLLFLTSRFIKFPYLTVMRTDFFTKQNTKNTDFHHVSDAIHTALIYFPFLTVIFFLHPELQAQNVSIYGPFPHAEWKKWDYMTHTSLLEHDWLTQLKIHLFQKKYLSSEEINRSLNASVSTDSPTETSSSEILPPPHDNIHLELPSLLSSDTLTDPEKSSDPAHVANLKNSSQKDFTETETPSFLSPEQISDFPKLTESKMDEELISILTQRENNVQTKSESAAQKEDPVSLEISSTEEDHDMIKLLIPPGHPHAPKDVTDPLSEEVNSPETDIFKNFDSTPKDNTIKNTFPQTETQNPADSEHQNPFPLHTSAHSSSRTEASPNTLTLPEIHPEESPEFIGKNSPERELELLLQALEENPEEKILPENTSFAENVFPSDKNTQNTTDTKNTSSEDEFLKDMTRFPDEDVSDDFPEPKNLLTPENPNEHLSGEDTSSDSILPEVLPDTINENKKTDFPPTQKEENPFPQNTGNQNSENSLTLPSLSEDHSGHQTENSRTKNIIPENHFTKTENSADTVSLPKKTDFQEALSPTNISQETQKTASETSHEIHTETPEDHNRLRKFPPLSAAEIELAARLKRTTDVYRQISMATEENRPSDIMMFTIPYGCKVAIYNGCRESEKHINAIGALCWNFPMREQVTFNTASDSLMPNLGYGVQRYPGQLLATFALSRVSTKYKFPARFPVPETSLSPFEKNKTELPQNQIYSVSTLVDFEKTRCREGADLSYSIIGLSYYLSPETKWEDRDGNLWSLEKMVLNELTRKPNIASMDITNQLFGLTCALRCRKQRSDAPLSPIYLAAEKYLTDFRQFALRNQNAWFCWHPRYFEYRGISNSQRKEMFFASANILRWLVLETPNAELADPRIIQAMDTLERLTYAHLQYWDPAEASSQEIEGVSAALHAMIIFQKRYFNPRK